MSSWALGVGDWVTCPEELFDDYTPPTEHKLETRPKVPVDTLRWAKQARNGIWVHTLVYGEEHWEERATALDTLVRLHEDKPRKYSPSYIRDAWEELNSRWWEELKWKVKETLRLTGKTHPRRDDFLFAALTPTASGDAMCQTPYTFDLEDPDGYYQTVILARLESLAEKSYWDGAHAAKLRPLKAGVLEETEESGTGGAGGGGAGRGAGAGRGRGAGGRGAGAGRGGGAGGKGGGGGKDQEGAGGERVAGGAQAGTPKTTLPREVFSALTAAETVLARTHGPLDSKGKPKCWDATCHDGCPRTATTCERSHADGIKQVEKLHWTAKAHLIRRGGVKSGPKIPMEARLGRIQQLRAEAQKEQAAKVAEGVDHGNRKKHGGRLAGDGDSGGVGPTEYTEGNFTALESDLQQYTLGPTYVWRADHGRPDAPAMPTEIPDDIPPVAQER